MCGSYFLRNILRPPTPSVDLRLPADSRVTNTLGHTPTITTTRIVHTIEVHLVVGLVRDNFVTGKCTLIPVIKPRAQRIWPREGPRGRRTRFGGRTLYQFRRVLTNLAESPDE